MRIICAHTGNIHPKALEALKKYAPDTEYVDTSGSIFDYNEAVASRWTGKEDLVVIEQDKEITAEVVSAFASCDHFWCSYSYDVFPAPYTKEVTFGLGCSRYSAVVQRLVDPSEFTGPDPDILPQCRHCHGQGCWCYLDSRIAFALWNRMISVEVHGKVNHHHYYPADWPNLKGNTHG